MKKFIFNFFPQNSVSLALITMSVVFALVFCIVLLCLNHRFSNRDFFDLQNEDD